jgi:hypothetical protein
MASHGPDFSPVLASTPREVPGIVKSGGIALMVVGLLATAFGLFAVEGGATRVAMTFVVNFLYWAGIAQGAMMFCVAFVVVKGRWGRPLKRLAEGMALMLIPMYLLLIVWMLAGGMHIYEWTHWPEMAANDGFVIPHHKEHYLTEGFFMARMVVGVGVLIVLDLLFIRASLRSDLGVAKSKISGTAPAFWDKFIGGWKGDEAEIAASTKAQASIAPLIAIAYAVVFTMIAVDLSMSASPHWFANMYPAWYFMSCFWSALVYLGMFSLIARKWMGAEHLMKPNMYHDLGKLTFGLTMFWGYTLFAQYLPIWYGNMTEEIGFVLMRTEMQPWAPLSKVVFMMCFAVPWSMLLSRGLKKIPAAYLTVTTVIAIGLWLERYMQVVPSVWGNEHITSDVSAEALASAPIGIPEIGMTLGFLGLFITVVFRFLAKVPTVTFTDPYMQPDPDHVHVVPASQAHGH